MSWFSIIVTGACLLVSCVNAAATVRWSRRSARSAAKFERTRAEILTMDKELVALEVLREAAIRAARIRAVKDFDAIERAHNFIVYSRLPPMEKMPEGPPS